MRNAGERDRRRERAVASLGKHYPFSHSEPEPVAISERDPISFTNRFGNSVSVTVGDVRISFCESYSNAIASFKFGAHSFACGGSKRS